MSFDLDTLRHLTATHGRVARVVVADTRGSVPRETGAAMYVWQAPDGATGSDGHDGSAQLGTIGGGALELMAAQRARRAPENSGQDSTHATLTRHPLGPDLGQCCGGAVTLLTEHFTADTLPEPAALFARGPGDMPLAVRRRLARARAEGDVGGPALFGTWMVEPMSPPRRPLWIWGAGHVGRALAETLAPLSDFALTWIDTAPDRFPAAPPPGVTVLPAPDLAAAMRRAPRDAAHLILTYSHALDLALCDAALSHGFGFCGLIGSDTKRARFAKRLRAMGHSTAEISRICCPIGQKALGKHPQAIAIGVAAQILTLDKQENTAWTIPSSASTG